MGVLWIWIWIWVGGGTASASCISSPPTPLSLPPILRPRAGKTRTLNHFLINRKWMLVDCPGYGDGPGYQSSKQERHGWHELTTVGGWGAGVRENQDGNVKGTSQPQHGVADGDKEGLYGIEEPLEGRRACPRIPAHRRCD